MSFTSNLSFGVHAKILLEPMTLSTKIPGVLSEGVEPLQVSTTLHRHKGRLALSPGSHLEAIEN